MKDYTIVANVSPDLWFDSEVEAEKEAKARASKLPPGTAFYVVTRILPPQGKPGERIP